MGYIPPKSSFMEKMMILQWKERGFLENLGHDRADLFICMYYSTEGPGNVGPHPAIFLIFQLWNKIQDPNDHQ